HARHLFRDEFAGRLVADLGEWRGNITVDAARSRWKRGVDALELASPLTEEILELLRPAWQALERELPKDASLDCELLLEFLDDAVAAIPAGRFGPGRRTPHARVVLTSLRDAASQTWQACIVANANEGIWPMAIDEDRWLPDSRRLALNES